MRQRPILIALLALFTLTTSLARAQTTGFITPGTSGRESEIPDLPGFEDAIENSRWRVGIFHLSPWIGLRDVANVETISVGAGLEDDDDVTASAGAGLRAYVRNGPKVVWAVHALPEYTWWADDEGRRRLNGRYGAGVFVYRNRLNLELSQRLVEEQGFFSSEIRRLTPESRAISRALVDFRLVRNLWLSLGGSRTRFRNEEDDNPLLSSLDRTEESLRARLDFRSPRGWRIGLGVEDLETRFDDAARNLSSDSTGLVVDAGFDGNRFAGLLQLRRLDLEPAVGSAVPPSEELVGVLQLVFDVTERSALMTYGRRSLSFSVFDDSSFFLVDRIGARWQAALAPRIRIGLYAEVGEDEVEAAGVDATLRLDDVTDFGVEGSVELGDLLTLRLEARHSDVSSSLPEFDREVTAIGFSVLLRPLERITRRISDRLRLGEEADAW